MTTQRKEKMNGTRIMISVLCPDEPNQADAIQNQKRTYQLEQQDEDSKNLDPSEDTIEK